MAGGVILLTGYRLIRRRRRRRREGSGPLAPLSPLVPAIFFLIAPVLLFALNVTGVAVLPGMVVAACLAVAAGYGIRSARTLRPARRGPGSGARARPRSESG